MPSLPLFLLDRIGPLRHFRPLRRPGEQQSTRLQWLFAPSLPAVGFAVRTTIAALIALVIALWMELDDPQWAAMTVWIVAQGSRGESLSKARWRLVGTVVGVVMSITLISAFIQQAWLFFPALAIWVGLCCGLATVVRNFRSYALVLAGYTCAIIAIGAIPNPENVFITALSRATYIVLGIVCESVVAGMFAHNLAATARKNMRDKLRTALGNVSNSVASLLSGDDEALVRSRAMFGPILSINDQIEFSEVEMGPHGHEGDHARAALAAVSVLLSRGLGMAVRLQYVDTDQPAFRETAIRVSTFLNGLSPQLETDETVQNLLRELQLLRAECRQQIVDALTSEISTPFAERDYDKVQALLDGRILHNALDELLGELEQAIREYDASQHVIRGDHFHFRLQSHVDKREAAYNGIRATVAIAAAGLVWEVTAWSSGLGFITFVAIVCGLFATRENPVVATTQFMVGSLWAALVSFFLVFVVLPTQADYEMLVASLALPMIAGGLAARNAATALHSAAYTLLLPNFVHPLNQGRQNEIGWFNSTAAVLLGVAFAVIMFRAILPFSSSAERWRMRRTLLRDLRTLASAEPMPQTRDWIGRNIDRFARLIRHAGPTPSPTIEGCLQGTLAAMTIGLNIIRLRALLERDQIPPSARRPIEVVMQRMSRFTGKYGRTARSASLATQTLRRIEAVEPNITIRIELTRAIAYLIVVSHELEANAVFLDATKPYRAV
ncbi:FUSC family protein [Acetobacter indonesiensis]|uniref:Fusaric acid resistance protein FusB n=1 Tax=Acetobacter indonesiensis TaxID=104101 RepID=A0A252AX08_9PROT|nr:FUSC family protein [Acetobacter indonesiensis]MCG0994058.1 FUSC family protein [Acetobacter indonesiensis]MCI1438816.1 FUSC family protein [Acetobacter indonesiensis]MCI1545065.1 FUSC family protein [Acetobacter indonesiensis]MCI1764691.1 FUSC family protein [Acetobacter indonesiensis]MCP1230611.1 FUSC family protein [Acetobacter indonesiensis]